MTRRFVQSAVVALLLAGLAGRAAASDEQTPPPAGDKAPTAPGDVRKNPPAPHGLSFFVTEPARVVCPVSDEDAFAEFAGSDPARFREQDGHFTDARGEYVWDEDEEIYWQLLSPEVLTRGRQDYVQFCASCHGFEGDGYGRSAQALRPPPRDFRQSTFKFTKVPSDKLPSDDALVRLVRHGLDGTPMLPWAVSDERLHEIVQYLKSLSPEGKGWRDATNEIGAVVDAGTDPWAGREAEAVAAGEKAYHVRQCWSCHPAYVPPGKLNALRGIDAGTSYADDLSYPKLKRDSSYQVLGYKVAIIAPDFTWHTIRYGRDAREVFESIGAGIGGAGMPTWKGALPDEEIWAIAHYVRHLVDEYKGKPGREAFMASIRSGK